MGREKGGGAEFSGIPISPQVDAGVSGFRDSRFSVSGRRAILGTTEGLTSGVSNFAPRTFLLSGASSGAGVLAGLGAVFGGCHRDSGGRYLGGTDFLIQDFCTPCNHVCNRVHVDTEHLRDRFVAHPFLVLLQNRSVAFLLQLHREGWGRSRGWDFWGFPIFPKVASGRPRGWDFCGFRIFPKEASGRPRDLFRFLPKGHFPEPEGRTSGPFPFLPQGHFRKRKDRSRDYAGFAPRAFSAYRKDRPRGCPNVVSAFGYPSGGPKSGLDVWDHLQTDLGGHIFPDWDFVTPSRWTSGVSKGASTVWTRLGRPRGCPKAVGAFGYPSRQTLWRC